MPADEHLDFFGQLYGIDLPTPRKRAGQIYWLEDGHLREKGYLTPG